MQEHHAVAGRYRGHLQRIQVDACCRLDVFKAVGDIVLAFADERDYKSIRALHDGQIKIYYAVAAAARVEQQGVLSDAYLRLDDVEAVKRVVQAVADGVGEQSVVYGVNLQIKEDDAVAAVLVSQPQRVDISSDLRMVVVEAVQHIVIAVADRVDDKSVEVGNHSQVEVHCAVAAVAVHKEQRVVYRAHLRLDDLEAVKQVVDAMTDCVDDIFIAVGPHLKAKVNRAVAAVLIAQHYAVDAVARLWLQNAKSVVGVVIAFADGGNEVGLVRRHDGELQIREAVAAAECLKVQSVEVQADWHNRVVEAVKVVLLTLAHAVGEVVGVDRVDLQLKVHRAVAAVD